MKNNKVIYPQEVEVLYILPAIRRELAYYYKLQGLGQKEIAELLKVSEPAISQYLKSKRATQVVFSEAEKDEIKKSAERLKQSKRLVEETERILNVMKSNKLTCRTCLEFTSLPEGCNACFQVIDNEPIQK